MKRGTPAGIAKRGRTWAEATPEQQAYRKSVGWYGPGAYSWKKARHMLAQGARRFGKNLLHAGEDALLAELGPAAP